MDGEGTRDRRGEVGEEGVTGEREEGWNGKDGRHEGGGQKVGEEESRPRGHF